MQRSGDGFCICNYAFTLICPWWWKRRDFLLQIITGCTLTLIFSESYHTIVWTDMVVCAVIALLITAVEVFGSCVLRGVCVSNKTFVSCWYHYHGSLRAQMNHCVSALQATGSSMPKTMLQSKLTLLTWIRRQDGWQRRRRCMQYVGPYEGW
jgi:hypothetical protein